MNYEKLKPSPLYKKLSHKQKLNEMKGTSKFNINFLTTKLYTDQYKHC